MSDLSKSRYRHEKPDLVLVLVMMSAQLPKALSETHNALSPRHSMVMRAITVLLHGVKHLAFRCIAGAFLNETTYVRFGGYKTAQ